MEFNCNYYNYSMKKITFTICKTIQNHLNRKSKTID